KQLLIKVISLFSICFIFMSQGQAQQLYFQNFNTENGLVQSQTTCLAQDKFNRLWIGTWGGLSVFDGSYYRNYTRPEGLKSKTILDIDLMHDGTAWIGTSEGVSHFDGLRFFNYSLSSKPDSNWVVGIRVDNRNRIWALSRNKLFLFSDGKFIAKKHLHQDIIVSLFKDQTGIIHIAYLRSGIYKYEQDRWQQVMAPPKGFLLTASIAPDRAVYAIGTEGLFKSEDGTAVALSRTLPQ